MAQLETPGTIHPAGTFSLGEDQKMKVVTYKCAKCGTVERLRFFQSEAVMPQINCGKCHAGRNTDMATAIYQHVGMFPVEGAVLEA